MAKFKKLLGNGEKSNGSKAPANGPAPIHVSDSEFEELVLNAEAPALVDFWAPWCMPCRMIAPTLEKLAAEYDGRALIAKVNTDENQQWAAHYGVQGIPTLLFIKDGQVVDRVVGVTPAGQLKQKLEKMIE